MAAACLCFFLIHGLLTHAQFSNNRQQVSFSSMRDLELDLGSTYGLSPWTMEEGGIAQGTVQNVMSGAQKRNPESLYFLGLLRLYGQGGLPEDQEKVIILEAAELGHVEAQSAIGMLFLHGIGVTKDEKAAALWLRKAVQNNDRDACWILGKLLFDIEYKKASETSAFGNYDESLALMQRAANAGAKEGYYHLGLMHEYGQGLPLDSAAAVQFYRQSSQLGYVPAFHNLALMHAYGRGTEQNYREAYRLFQEAASKNHPASMYYCGVFAMNGHGIPIDYHQATLWFDQAARLGDPQVSTRAASHRDELQASIDHANKVNEELLANYAVNSDRPLDPSSASAFLANLDEVETEAAMGAEAEV